MTHPVKHEHDGTRRPTWGPRDFLFPIHRGAALTVPLTGCGRRASCFQAARIQQQDAGIFLGGQFGGCRKRHFWFGGGRTSVEEAR
jgi:hypothetical protein